MLQIADFPKSRLRRSRLQAWSRDLIAENNLSVNDLIWPVFVIEGTNQHTQVDSMPDVFRLSPDQLLKELEKAHKLGIKAIDIFPSLESDLKTADGREGINPDNLICRTIKLIKKEFPDIGIFADVALDCYTDHGHDGVFDGEEILNDKTLDLLSTQSLNFAEAGADVIAPSDMMDGRIKAIRETLEANHFENVQICSYAAKYASAYYGPFRDAVRSISKLNKKDKKSYQMDPRNSDEAMREVAQDISEGADYIIVKPGLAYLDVVSRIKSEFNIPVFSYHVSGEYAMLKAAAQNGWLDYEKTLLETMISFKRAGCSAILTYNAVEIAKMLKA